MRSASGGVQRCGLRRYSEHGRQIWPVWTFRYRQPTFHRFDPLTSTSKAFRAGSFENGSRRSSIRSACALLSSVVGNRNRIAPGSFTDRSPRPPPTRCSHWLQGLGGMACSVPCVLFRRPASCSVDDPQMWEVESPEMQDAQGQLYAENGSVRSSCKCLFLVYRAFRACQRSAIPLSTTLRGGSTTEP
jgi:hypothetical protein